ncbi:DUF4197 domain-containing protein [Denitrificimonas caeni]|uniref:DUF4197 domain-containing protein n=1 Tax=Denitrificimonas caeni TaxID=521720 RepID=UPI0003B40E41|nr:DUF4197 domain-containing protein [Denitrificimonas caeni]
MRAYLTGFIGLFFAAQACALSLNDLSQNQAGDGMKAMLEQSARVAIQQLSQPGGFNNNPDVRIELPGNLGKAARAMKMLGQGKQVTALENSMNRAAEAAIPQAQELLLDAVKKMTISDAKGILNGPENSATAYLDKSSREQLRSRFLPMIEQVTQSSGLAQQYNNFAGQAANFGVIDAKDASIENYVAEQALDGLFTIIAEQEASIRQNPTQAASDIAKKVFGLIR